MGTTVFLGMGILEIVDGEIKGYNYKENIN